MVCQESKAYATAEQKVKQLDVVRYGHDYMLGVTVLQGVRLVTCLLQQPKQVTSAELFTILGQATEVVSCEHVSSEHSQFAAECAFVLMLLFYVIRQHP